MKKTSFAFASLAMLVLLLAGCGSGGLGDILNQPQASSYPGTSDIFGTVNSVDSRNIYVNVSDYNGTRQMTVPYDSRTQVTYQGQYGNPSQLERGDQVTIRMNSNGIADLVTVTQSVSASSSPTYPGQYPTSTATGRIQGTVNYVDTAANLIQVNASYVTGLRTSSNNVVTIYYDTRTRVLFQGRTYSPTDLERGDQIDATMYNTGNGYLADTITVTRNVRQ